jgi:putative NADPH-quinone reductase
MKICIVFNHPYEGSYCSAILEAVLSGLHRGGHETDLMHLDRDRFDPVMTAGDLKGFTLGAPVDPAISGYKNRLEQAEHLVMIFPIWWELMPAMTKGFIDRVIFPGVAYDYDKSSRFPRMVKRFRLLRGITLITTMNTPSVFYRIIFGNAIKRALFTGTFWKMGYRNRKWISLNMVKFVSEKKRLAWLSDLESRFERLT